MPASVFSKTVYKLHPSFEKRATQSETRSKILPRVCDYWRDPVAFTNPPFRISEEGWGEFDMEIILTAIDKGGEFPMAHDLNFQSNRYEAKHTIVSLWLQHEPRDHWAEASTLTRADLQKSQTWPIELAERVWSCTWWWEWSQETRWSSEKEVQEIRQRRMAIRPLCWMQWS